MKDNKLIAEFMGWEVQYHLTNSWYGAYREPNGKLHKNTDDEPLLFHESWDWLMPVIEEIDHLQRERIQSIEDALSTRCLGDVYNAVVKFIKEYNNEQ